MYNGHPAVYKVWDIADACEEDEQDPCWSSIRKEKAAYDCLQGNLVQFPYLQRHAFVLKRFLAVFTSAGGASPFCVCLICQSAPFQQYEAFALCAMLHCILQMQMHCP